MKDVTKVDIQTEIDKGGLVLVDFWAVWCRPCKAMLPIFEQLEQDVATLTILKVNADINPDLVEEFAISSIPTMILYKNGEHMWTEQGAKPRGRMLELITPFV